MGRILRRKRPSIKALGTSLLRIAGCKKVYWSGPELDEFSKTFEVTAAKKGSFWKVDGRWG
jgi:hypothetical protein